MSKTAFTNLVGFANSSNKVQIDFVSSEEDYKVIANETKLKFVISNIINNAKESIPSRIKGNIDVSLTYNNFEYVLKVKDNGRGIDSKNLSKVFDRGVSIDKPGGCGLGLSDARESIDKINGKIEISSAVAVGTTVTIRLPVVSTHIMSVGSSPYDHVFIEDYKLTQLLWIEAAREMKINFAVFSSPSEFDRNIKMVCSDARIYVDSHFPDTNVRGEDWAESLFSKGYRNIWLCSTEQIPLNDRPWIKGSVSKEKPFEDLLESTSSKVY